MPNKPVLSPEDKLVIKQKRFNCVRIFGLLRAIKRRALKPFVVRQRFLLVRFMCCLLQKNSYF